MALAMTATRTAATRTAATSILRMLTPSTLALGEQLPEIVEKLRRRFLDSFERGYHIIGAHGTDIDIEPRRLLEIERTRCVAAKASCSALARSGSTPGGAANGR